MTQTQAETQSTQSEPGVLGSASETRLPPLSDQDFRAYNRFAEKMNLFHNFFRQEWTLMHDACAANKRPQGMSIRQFINVGLSFCKHLETHHGIEEAVLFPALGKRMSAFANQDELKGQHRKIHAGLVRMQAYLDNCASGESELRLTELKAIMDSFGGHLWQHLDEEVQILGADNMRKYWTKKEMDGIWPGA